MSNGIGALKSAMLSQPVVRSAIVSVGSDPGLARAVLDRIRELLSIEVDPTKLHPFDAAVATYLLVLGEANLNSLREALGAVEQCDLPNLFWAYAAYGLLTPRVESVDTVTLGASGEAHQPPSQGSPQDPPRIVGTWAG